MPALYCIIIFAISFNYSLAGAVVIHKDEPQLFIDDFLIESSDGLRRTLHEPTKDHGGNRPVIELVDEFGENNGSLQAATILFDSKLGKYVMFTTGYGSKVDDRKWDFLRIYRYTSSDGMNWIRGDNGEADWVFPRSPEDYYDPASDTYATNLDAHTFYYDANDPEFPYKGWIWFANWGDEREGMYYMRSHDGRHWERGIKVLPYITRHFDHNGIPMAGTGDMSLFGHDPVTGRFLASLRFYRLDYEGKKNGMRSRGFMYFDRLDEPIDLDLLPELNLIPPARDFGGDLPDDEYYSVNVWPYGRLWLGELRLYHSGDPYPYSAADCTFFKLVSSRDGLHWKKVPYVNTSGIPEVFIPNGPEGGNNGRNDGGYFTEMRGGPLTINNELIFYYGSSSFGKKKPNPNRLMGGGIFRARLRIDGFVSIDAGTLTTPSLKIEGENLYVNSVGNIEVSIINEKGQRIVKTKLKDDNIRNHVLFKGHKLTHYWTNGKSKLQFKITKNAQLYAFRVE